MIIIYTTSFNLAAYIITLTWDDTKGMDTDIQMFDHVASICMGSQSFNFHTPAQSFSTNFFVIFCIARNHLCVENIPVLQLYD